MKLSLRALRRRNPDRLIIESVDLSLYIAHAVIEGERHLIVTEDGRALRTRNLLDMKTALAKVHAREIVLSQRSAYDEMVGHGHAPGDNRLELPLAPGFEALPPWQH